MKLNWKGLEQKISPKGKEMLQEMLTRHGEFVIVATLISQSVAEKLASNNRLKLRYERIVREGKPILHYLFSIDTQRAFRDKMRERQQLRYWFGVAATGLVAYMVGLLGQYIYWR